MRSVVVTLFAACAALAMRRRWRRRQHRRPRRNTPAAPRRPTRCRSTFHTGRRSPPNRPRRSSRPRRPRRKKTRATGCSRSRWSIRPAISSTSTRWTRPSSPRSRSRRTRPGRRRASAGRQGASSIGMQTPASVYAARSTTLIASHGGFPLIEGGKIIGAIGCSGGTGAQDGGPARPASTPSSRVCAEAMPNRAAASTPRPYAFQSRA